MNSQNTQSRTASMCQSSCFPPFWSIVFKNRFIQQKKKTESEQSHNETVRENKFAGINFECFLQPEVQFLYNFWYPSNEKSSLQMLIHHHMWLYAVNAKWKNSMFANR